MDQSNCIVLASHIRDEIAKKVRYDNQMIDIVSYEGKYSEIAEYEKRLIEYDTLLEIFDNSLQSCKTEYSFGILDIIKQIRRSPNIHKIIGYIRLSSDNNAYHQFEIGDIINIDTDHIHIFETPPDLLIIYTNVKNKMLPDIDHYRDTDGSQYLNHMYMKLTKEYLLFGFGSGGYYKGKIPKITPLYLDPYEGYRPIRCWLPCPMCNSCHR
jgi:hypothetical protein